jgi:uncharacterized membrane protein
MAANMPVWDTIVEAWNKTYGVKGSFWAAFGIMIAIAIGFGIVEGLIPAIAAIITLLSSLVAFLLRAGAIYMGIVRARSEPVNYQQVFRAMNFNLGWRVIAVYILQILISLPFVGIILISGMLVAQNSLISLIVGIIGVVALIYISVRVAFGMCFVVDKGTSPGEAIVLSFSQTRDHIWPLIGIFLLFACLFIISAIPFGIGLIWTLPYSFPFGIGLIWTLPCSFVLYGLVYKKLIS